jgi:hypothetical protein
MCDIQKELQVVLDIIKENDFHSAFEGGKNDGNAIYIPKGLFERDGSQN